MATYKTVVPQTDEESIRKTLTKKYGSKARIELEEHEDFLGQTWIEAVIRI
jgi:hypothetical protein